MLTFKVEGNCVPKQRPRKGKGGQFYTPKRTLDYEEKVRVAALAKKARPSDKVVMLKCRFHFDDRRNRDLDNCVKSVSDALNGVAWDDDAQICHLHAHKYYNHQGGYTEVIIDYYDRE